MSEFAQPRRVQRNDARMSPVSLALLHYVTAHPKSSFGTLLSLFGPVDASKQGVETFRSRLHYLVQAGHLQWILVRSKSHYSLGDSVPLVRKSTSEVCLIASDTFTCSVRVPSPSYDRMHGPDYVPPADACPRAAGLDYKRVASRGFPC